MASVLALVISLALMLGALACDREHRQRRLLEAPLGPSGNADTTAQPVPPLPIEPAPRPHFQVRLGTGAATAGGTGMGDSPQRWRVVPFTPGEPPAPEPLVVDTHVDTPIAMLSAGFDVLQPHATGHFDLPRMRRGGLNAAFFSVWVDPREYRRQAGYEQAMRIFRAIHEVAWRSRDAVLVDTTDALRRVVDDEQVAILIGVEGGHALGTNDSDLALTRLRTFRALGARYMTLTWSTDNPLGHSSTGRHPERGLTELGRVVIAEMERVGLVVDVSHVSDQTFFDIMAIATRPVLATHSNARALSDHPRNMSDEMIRLVADNGGAICVNYFTDYLDVGYVQARDRLSRAHRQAFDQLELEERPYTERGPARRALVLELEPSLAVPDVSTVIDHILHIAEVGGPDTVCLGSDFDGVPELPQGLDDVSQLPALRAELASRGLPMHHQTKILGGNVMRVLRAGEPH